MLQEGDVNRIFISQEEVNENEAPRWTKKKNLPEVTESYDKFMKKQVGSILLCTFFAVYACSRFMRDTSQILSFTWNTVSPS